MKHDKDRAEMKRLSHALRRHRLLLPAGAIAFACIAGAVLLPLTAGGQDAEDPPGEEGEEGPGGPPGPISAAEFSHKVHVPAMGQQCVLCHQPRSGGKFYLTDQKVCWNCHTEDQVPADQRDAFQAEMQKFVRPRIVGPFHHDRHLRNSKAAGQPAERCIDCHQGIDNSTRTAEPNIPTMEYCYTCHQQIETVSAPGAPNLAGKDGTECSLCHVPGDFNDEKWQALAEALASGQTQEEIDRDLIPESHQEFLDATLGAGRSTGYYDRTWIPVDHTEFFRTVSHGRRSRSPAAKCEACHTDGESCTGCHLYELPRNHTPRFIRSYHGRYATIDRYKCTVCHQSDFCDSCHDQAPRNHSIAFQQGDHGFAARVELRSCYQCHEFAVTCIRCHNQ